MDYFVVVTGTLLIAFVFERYMLNSIDTIFEARTRDFDKKYGDAYRAICKADGRFRKIEHRLQKTEKKIKLNEN